MERKTELSVHSLKDMPMEVPEELPLIAFSKRRSKRRSGTSKGVTQLDT